MKELRFYANEAMAHNEFEKSDRDAQILLRVLNMCKLHRLGLLINDYRIYVSFYNANVLELLMNTMQADGILSLMHHETGSTRVLMVELVRANWGLYGAGL